MKKVKIMRREENGKEKGQRGQTQGEKTKKGRERGKGQGEKGEGKGEGQRQGGCAHLPPISVQGAHGEGCSPWWGIPMAPWALLSSWGGHTVTLSPW